MTDYTELLERLDNFADYESENKEAVKAIRALQKQVVVLKSKISKFIYGEENPNWVDPEQTKIIELQKQVKEYEQVLTDLAISPSPAGMYWKDFATNALKRIKAMGDSDG